MTAHLKDIRLMAKFTKRNNEYENTKSEYSRTVDMSDENKHDYEEVNLTNTNENENGQQNTKQNEYNDFNDKQRDKSNIDIKKDVKTEKISNINDVPLPKPVLGNTKKIVIKWKIISLIAIILCVGLAAALITLISLALSCKVSPCEGVGCLHNGSCSISDDKAICSCIKGFNGSKCEVTPCDNFICENTGTCYLHNFSPKCICPEGFTGMYCSITPCSGVDCLNNGTCTYTTSSLHASCQCPPGFSGETCEVTPCSSLPCLNNGICGINGSTYTCTCMNGISGNHCQTKTDMYGNQCPFNPCSRLPCKNNGICRVDGSSYTCTCTSGSFGTDCEDLKCNFEIKEDPNCFLQQDLSDDANWIHWSGKTPTSETGPEAAYEGCYYYYFETSNPLRSGSKSRLISKNLDIDVNRCLTFTYHMYGEHMGTLNIYQMSDLKWTRSGNQNNSWKLDKIHLDEKLTDSKGYSKITFEAIRGTSYLSDIAIDNVKILTC